VAAFDESRKAIWVVTGKGKGKTTYCLGKALLMSSMGVRCFILQAIKSPRRYGEVMAIEKLSGMEIQSLGKGLVDKSNPDEDASHKIAAREAWSRAKEIVTSSRYGLVVLDEINIAVNYGYIQYQEVLDLLHGKAEGCANYFGRTLCASRTDERFAAATMEMKELKHPYKMGINARWGIEY
jgi:cob(I)alamin adenosyltransferase